MGSAAAFGALFQEYRRLGLEPGSPREAVRQAYLRLAREWHPDRNGSDAAAAEFQEIARAYHAICDAPPSGHMLNAWLDDAGSPEPLRCTACGGVAIEPRALRFTQVFSFALFSWRRYSGGLLCAPCARRTSMRASAISALFGWWSLPGLILTPLAILGNAGGGERDADAEAPLLFYNLLAFRARSQHRAVAQIVARLRAGGEERLPIAESFVVAAVADDPRTRAAGTGQDPWATIFGDKAAQLLIAIAVPLAALALINAWGISPRHAARAAFQPFHLLFAPAIPIAP